MGNLTQAKEIIGIPNSTLVKTALNATGTAPIYACRAWVNFNGTGTVAIRASGNVSSITDNGVGDYTVNFTTAMVDANYCLSGIVSSNVAWTRSISLHNTIGPTTSNVRIYTGPTGANAYPGALEDYSIATIQVHR